MLGKILIGALILSAAVVAYLLLAPTSAGAQTPTIPGRWPRYQPPAGPNGGLSERQAAEISTFSATRTGRGHF